jgi:PIN domain nuclease of toxin-antitoxin system
LLAFLQGEPGADEVEAALLDGTWISAVNWTETLSKLSDHGQDPGQVVRFLEDKGILGSAVQVHPVDELLARQAAQLRRSTRNLGLSLGDRACLALAYNLRLDVLTADQAWARLDSPVQVRLIR